MTPIPIIKRTLDYKMPRSNAGFTLIELMLALALGLLISAAAFMLFLTGQRSYSLQQGSADLQDNANFGLSYIAKDLRLTNLNTQQAAINDRTKTGGLVLTSAVNGFKDTSVTPNKIFSNLPESIKGTTAALGLLSASELHTSNAREGGADIKSDQLVIQYKPQYVQDGTDWVGGFDCEGNEIRFPRQTGSPAIDAPLRIIVQRYFLREDSNKTSNEPNATLALACDAGWYVESGNPTKVENYGGEGQIIMKRVDYFHIMLGIQNGDKHRYMAIKDYMGLTVNPKPRILSIQLGALVRSSQSVGSDDLVKNDQVFTVLDKDVTVKPPNGKPPQYIRQVVSQTVALRNTFGERGQ